MTVAYYSYFIDIQDGTISNETYYSTIFLDDFRDFLDNTYSIQRINPDTDEFRYTKSYFLGYTNSGEPVFENLLGDKFILTNTPYADGAPAPTFTPATGDFVACFLSGTLISTPQGATPVEALAADDLVTISDGGVAKVKWIGRQTVVTMFGGGQERAPIRIAAGALGPNLPARDLKLTADHALLLDGVLVQAGALVNGTTIRRMTRADTGDRYQVFHIETEGHEIILAEGCAAETFVDSVTRKRFDNYAEYEALFGDEAETILEMDLPRAMSARQLPDRLRALIKVRRAA